MLPIIIVKEMRLYFASPKFVTVFITFSVLMLLSVYLGIREYQTAVVNYETSQQLVNQSLAERSNWDGTSLQVIRRPDPMQIFVSGVSNDIGRLSDISKWDQVKLRNSPYSDDPLFAVFRFLDFSFIVQVVLSLLAIMFTYDAINGERESGTLKLTFASGVSRLNYLVAKICGAWLGLIIPILIPLLLSVFLLIVFAIPFNAAHWIKFLLLLASSVGYFTFFILCGIAVSAISRTSAASFLILLVLWVVLVLIVPRASVMASATMIPVPGIAEIEAQIEGFSSEQMKQHEKSLGTIWKKRNAEMDGMDKTERQAYEDEHMWAWMEEDEAARKDMQARISSFARKVKEQLRNRKALQEQLAFSLSRFSPASAFQLAAMQLTATGIEMKSRYEKAMEAYHDQFVSFVEQKKKEGDQPGGLRIEFDTDSGFSFQTADMKKRIDASELPRFRQPDVELASAISGSLLDITILLAFCVFTFMIAWAAFRRYDLR